MYGYIYKTTNLINNKIYIGQHKASKFSKKYLGSGCLIRRAINEFGKSNFIVELLCECLNSDELDKKEIFYIKEFNSTDLNIGYNLTFGGQERFFTGCSHTEESRKKMSQRAKNRPHPPTTAGRIYVHKDNTNACINKDDLDKYLNDGYSIGKIILNKKPAWNKGLTKETNDSVKKYSETRNKLFNDNKSIGCFGRVEDNVNRVKFLNKIKSINKEEFINDYLTKGKCYCLSKHHFKPNKWKEICDYFNITESNNKTWKNHGKSLLEENHEPNP